MCPQATVPPAGHTGETAEAQHSLETLAELKGGNWGSSVGLSQARVQFLSRSLPSCVIPTRWISICTYRWSAHL